MGRRGRRTAISAAWRRKRCEIHSEIDWFELRGGVSFDDQRVALPALLQALERGDGFVTLADGSVGMLPEELLRKYAPIASLGVPSGEHVRFRRTQAALLDALVTTVPDVSWDESFAAARNRLEAFEGVQPADPPASFRGVLREYQREGLGWLRFLEQFGFGGCLADDMGLGKTVMVLALLAGEHRSRGDDSRPSLVVAPRSVVFNWREEAARFAPMLRVPRLRSAPTARLCGRRSRSMTSC